ncbi:GNAT family N-acetyltransferase [bacterium]|nr:GNAT family N-acetyltransferase [bacterium]
MKVNTYIDAEIFLRNTYIELESNEAANSLMLGICGQLIRHPERVKAAPCLKTVGDENGLILAAIMTPPHKLVVYGHQGDLGIGTRILVKKLVSEGWAIPGVLGPSEVAKGIAERWAEVTRRGYGLERRQRVYELRAVINSVPERGKLRLATEADIELVAQWRYQFHLEIFGEVDPKETKRAAKFRIEEMDIYLWEDGHPVSIAMKTRPTRKGISVSSVYTPPELRRRGYATACVGELSRMLLESGWEFCSLFADLSNATSNRIYQRIGYRPVCDYDEYVFPAASSL